MARDPFSRRTATPSLLFPWLVELARTPRGLLASYLPGRGIDPTTRERIILAVTEVNGCRYCAWIHGSWHDFLGEDGRAGAEELLLTFARACADAGRPLDTAPLSDAMPAAAVDAVRATVAQIEISNLVGNTVDGLIARLTRKRPLAPLVAVQEVAVVAAALPLAIPLLALAAALRGVERMAPPTPPVRIAEPGEANLLVHLLAEAAPVLLRNALVRATLLGLPFSAAVAVRAGRTTATVRVGRGGVEVENGIAADARVVVQGEVESLLRLATGDFTQGLGDLRIRPA